jgi:hypothetical protein
MTAGRVTLFPIAFQRLQLRWLIRLFVGISTVVGFLSFYDIHSYMPWDLQFTKALGRTLEIHSGLWLATLEIRSRWRFLVALLLVPSGVGVYLFWWHKNQFTLIAAAVALGWLLYKVIRGKPFDAESV